MHEQSTEKKHSTMLPRAIKPSLTHFRPTYKTVGGNNLDSFFFFLRLNLSQIQHLSNSHMPDPVVLSKPYRLFVKQIQ